MLPRLIINAVALWLATRVIDGITFNGDWFTLVLVGLLFGLLNAIVRPVLKLLTLPLMILSLGLFTFVLNAFMLWLTARVSEAGGLGFHVAGARPAFLGALFVTVVSFVLSLLVGPRQRRQDRRE